MSYTVDIDLFNGWSYPPFEQLGHGLNHNKFLLWSSASFLFKSLATKYKNEKGLLGCTLHHVLKDLKSTNKKQKVRDHVLFQTQPVIALDGATQTTPLTLITIQLTGHRGQ